MHSNVAIPSRDNVSSSSVSHITPTHSTQSSDFKPRDLLPEFLPANATPNKLQFHSPKISDSPKIQGNVSTSRSDIPQSGLQAVRPADFSSRSALTEPVTENFPKFSTLPSHFYQKAPLPFGTISGHSAYRTSRSIGPHSVRSLGSADPAASFSNWTLREKPPSMAASGLNSSRITITSPSAEEKRSLRGAFTAAKRGAVGTKGSIVTYGQLHLVKTNSIGRHQGQAVRGLSHPQQYRHYHSNSGCNSIDNGRFVNTDPKDYNGCIGNSLEVNAVGNDNSNGENKVKKSWCQTQNGAALLGSPVTALKAVKSAKTKQGQSDNTAIEGKPIDLVGGKLRKTIFDVFDQFCCYCAGPKFLAYHKLSGNCTGIANDSGPSGTKIDISGECDVKMDHPVSPTALKVVVGQELWSADDKLAGNDTLGRNDSFRDEGIGHTSSENDSSSSPNSISDITCPSEIETPRSNATIIEESRYKNNSTNKNMNRNNENSNMNKINDDSNNETGNDKCIYANNSATATYDTQHSGSSLGYSTTFQHQLSSPNPCSVSLGLDTLSSGIYDEISDDKLPPLPPPPPPPRESARFSLSTKDHSTFHNSDPDGLKSPEWPRPPSFVYSEGVVVETQQDGLMDASGDCETNDPGSSPSAAAGDVILKQPSPIKQHPMSSNENFGNSNFANSTQQLKTITESQTETDSNIATKFSATLNSSLFNDATPNNLANSPSYVISNHDSITLSETSLPDATFLLTDSNGNPVATYPQPANFKPTDNKTSTYTESTTLKCANEPNSTSYVGITEQSVLDDNSNYHLTVQRADLTVSLETSDIYNPDSELGSICGSVSNYSTRSAFQRLNSNEIASEKRGNGNVDHNGNGSADPTYDSVYTNTSTSSGLSSAYHQSCPDLLQPCLDPRTFGTGAGNSATAPRRLPKLVSMSCLRSRVQSTTSPRTGTLILQARQHSQRPVWEWKPIKRWNLDDILTWLQHIRLDDIASVAVGYELTGAELQNWDQAVLENLNVSEDSQNVLLKELKALKQLQKNLLKKRTPSRCSLYPLLEVTSPVVPKPKTQNIDSQSTYPGSMTKSATFTPLPTSSPLAKDSTKLIVALTLPLGVTCLDFTVAEGANGGLMVTSVKKPEEIPVAKRDCIIEANGVCCLSMPAVDFNQLLAVPTSTHKLVLLRSANSPKKSHDPHCASLINKSPHGDSCAHAQHQSADRDQSSIHSNITSNSLGATSLNKSSAETLAAQPNYQDADPSAFPAIFRQNNYIANNVSPRSRMSASSSSTSAESTCANSSIVNPDDSVSVAGSQIYGYINSNIKMGYPDNQWVPKFMPLCSSDGNWDQDNFDIMHF